MEPPIWPTPAQTPPLQLWSSCARHGSAGRGSCTKHEAELQGRRGLAGTVLPGPGGGLPAGGRTAGSANALRFASEAGRGLPAGRGVSPRWGPQVHEASGNLGLAAGAARRFRGNRTVLQTPLTGPCGHVHERRGWASRRLEAQPSCSLPTPRNDGHRPVEFTKGTNHRESLCAGCVAPPQSDHHGRQVTPMPGGGGGMGHAGQRDGLHTRIRFHCTPGEPRQ